MKSVSDNTLDMYKKVGYLPEELKILYVNVGVYNELFSGRKPINESMDVGKGNGGIPRFSKR